VAFNLVKNKVRSVQSLVIFRYFAISVPIVLVTACASQNYLMMSEVRASEGRRAASAAQFSPAVDADLDDSSRRLPTSFVNERLSKWTQQQVRLYTVASPLLLKNAAICKKKSHMTLGLTAKTKYSYTADFVEAAEQRLGLSDRLQVMHVMPGSGAEKSGLRRGDILVRLDNQELPFGPNAEREGAALMAAATQGKSEVTLTVKRDGRELDLNVPLSRACNFSVELGNASHVNAYSDGNRTLITAGMLDYVRSDTELAIVVAKEIAHNIVIRAPRQHMTDAIDELRTFGAAPKSLQESKKIRPYTQVMDATADKYSLYLLARAGYDIDKVLPFWKSLASQFPEAQPNSYTALHPSTAYRSSVIAAVSGVVKHQMKHRLPLVPH
jgi:beta-barrel assembly-enhancing protease